MNQQRHILILLALLLSLSAAISSRADEVKIEDSRNCISTRMLRNTAVIDDKNVLFFMVGQTVFHNVLPKQCKGLARSGSFTYSSLGGGLCSFDSIQVMAASGFQNGRTCRLGRFHPTTKSGVAAIVERLRQRSSIGLEEVPPAEIEEIREIEEADEIEEIILESDGPQD